MAESKQLKTKKIAVVQLNHDPNLESIDDGGSEEIENWPEDGRDNIIPVGRPVRVSIHLAERLVTAGRINAYSIEEVPVFER